MKILVKQPNGCFAIWDEDECWFSHVNCVPERVVELCRRVIDTFPSTQYETKRFINDSAQNNQWSELLNKLGEVHGQVEKLQWEEVCSDEPCLG